MVLPSHSTHYDVKKFCYYDVVYKFDDENDRIVFGWVIGTHGADFAVINDHWEKLQRGQVRVVWFYADDRSEVEICQHNEVSLVNRKITAGMAVTRLRDGIRTEKGWCTRTKQTATVRIDCECTDTVVQHVDGNRFNDYYPFNIDDAVSFGDKVGRIKKVDRSLLLRSDKCNAMLKVRTSINENQIKSKDWVCNHKLNRFCQVVYCTPNSLLDPEWLVESETMNMETKQKFLVESFEINSVQVYWLLPNGSIEIGEVKGDDLKKLNVLDYEHDLKMADHYVIKTKPNDIMMEMSAWHDQLPIILQPREVKKEEKEELDNVPTSKGSDNLIAKSDDDSTLQGNNDSTSNIHGGSTLQNDQDSTSVTDRTALTMPSEVVVKVLYSETKVTVLWQDGTEEQNIPSIELHQCHSLDHDFFPGDLVKLKKPEENSWDWGVIKSVDFFERIAKVQWSAHAFGCPCSSCEQFENFHLTEHSVNDLVQHEQSIYNEQDVVYMSTPNGAMLGRIIKIIPENGSMVVQWSDNLTESCRPGCLGLAKLRNVSYLKQLHNRKRIESDTNVEAAENEKQLLVDEHEGFCLLDAAPERHIFHSSKFELKNMQKFTVAVHREYKLLKGSLPAGVWVRAYSDRTDLLSVMIRGAENTPYEDGLFLFDIQLPADYPQHPPQVHFINYTTERLNPNLYVEGKVCVSLLGTWLGDSGESWSTNSNLLQVIVSIQGLILVAEPYYNEPGFEQYRHTRGGEEKSRIYNASVILNVLKSMDKLLSACPREFKSAVLSHFKENGEKMCRRIEGYCKDDRPTYPLVPFSQDLKPSLKLHIAKFRKTLAKVCKDSEPTQLSG